MQAAEAAPLACTLDIGDMGDRLADIQRVTRRHLRFHRLEGLTLYLAYDRAAADEVTRLASLERACCAFLEFNLKVQPDGVELAITAPEEACDGAQWLFAKFMPEERAATPSPGGCACCRA
ncbi:hypothetical protein J7E62_31555 [Variovorax paradoxus]|nr:hypothetical protein [Variovorax paradoxus]